MNAISHLKTPLLAALLGLALAGCSKQDAPDPAAPAAAPTVQNASGDSNIGPGQRLSAGEYLQSPDTRYRMYMQDDGNLVIYHRPEYSVRWASNTQGHPGAYCDMQSDGNLVVYTPNRGVLWNAGARRDNPGHFVFLSSFGTLWYSYSGATVQQQITP